jgi:sterol 24-C-methyltransferase
VLDVGCGIGGPLRAISAFSGAAVIGVNNNEYQARAAQRCPAVPLRCAICTHSRAHAHAQPPQISRGTVLNAKTGHHDHCGFMKADFMRIPCDEATFDHAYQLEATCHAPDLRGCYAEILRTLRPGGCFASCDWVMTDRFDAGRPSHRQCKEDICLGNGLPDLRTAQQAVEALRAAGFEVLEAYDLADASEIPWRVAAMRMRALCFWVYRRAEARRRCAARRYDPIDKDRPLSLSLSGFRTTRVGRTLTHAMARFLCAFCILCRYISSSSADVACACQLPRCQVSLLEKARLAPAGSTSVSSFLVKGADALVAGGRQRIFTPMFFTLARKPL